MEYLFVGQIFPVTEVEFGDLMIGNGCLVRKKDVVSVDAASQWTRVAALWLEVRDPWSQEFGFGHAFCDEWVVGCAREFECLRGGGMAVADE